MQGQPARGTAGRFGEPSVSVGIDVVEPPPVRPVLGRGLVALPDEAGVYLSWRLLPEDAPDALHGVPVTGPRYRLYRGDTPDGPFGAVTPEPIAATCHLDATVAAGVTVYYRVAPVSAGGAEGVASTTARATAGSRRNHLRIESLASESIAKVVAGDLDGDQALDLVVVSPAVSEGSGGEFRLQAVLWREGAPSPAWFADTGIDPPSRRGASHEMPVALADMDGDGGDEIVTRMRVEGVESLVLLDGTTGDVERHAPWPDLPDGGLNDLGRNYLVVASLDGVHPYVVIQRGLYGLQRLVAYDAELRIVRDASFSGSSLGTHGLPAGDIDGDGAAEILMCGRAFGFGDGGADGTAWEDRWSANPAAPVPAHHDACFPADIRPDLAGLETFMGVEGSHRRAFLVGRDGDALWSVTGEYPSGWERGWCAELDRDRPGLECYAYDLDERSDPEVWRACVFDARGADITPSFPYFSGGRTDDHAAQAWPMDWDEGEGIDEIYAFTGAPGVTGGSWYSAWMGDILGDSREEAVVYNTATIRIFVNNELKDSMYLAPMSDAVYRAVVARAGVGYNSNYMPTLPGR
jgi:rhamnogalacturonan endolyase